MTGLTSRAWKPRPGRSRTVANAEQDKAAGGRHRRVVRLPSGETATGSVVLKPSEHNGVIHAHLRWHVDGRTIARSLGSVAKPTRMANLIEGWKIAHSKGLVHEEEAPAESWASSREVRASMRGNRGRDTEPERRLRAVLHSRGLRYRVSVRPLPKMRRTADVVFPGPRVAVFVDGCYWHGCPEHYRPATKNSEFWRTKIEDNKRRDIDTNRALAEHGWAVVRCWEHEDPVSVADRVAKVLEGRVNTQRR